MKKYLIIGLAIILGTNLFALGGVVYNRMGNATAQLTLTERELSLPYNNSTQKENSGISLSINWRTPTRTDPSDYSYNSHDVEITKDELLALGFNQIDAKDNLWVESKELYWAFEFDGALHKKEIKKAELNYQTALKNYQEQSNEANSRDKEKSKKRLKREKTSNSRLFFLDAAAEYKSLATKFSGQKNILIVKGLTKPNYNNKNKTYSLQLKHLSVRNILVPLENSKVFSTLNNLDRQDMSSPRYAVSIIWGSRLEPWVVDVKRKTIE